VATGPFENVLAGATVAAVPAVAVVGLALADADALALADGLAPNAD
jgi:hypothetical protein